MADETFPRIDPTRPIYSQITEGLMRRILGNEVHAGDALPSVRSLAETLRVNPNTVQRAYRELEALGVAESHPGQGTFVRTNSDALARIRERLADDTVKHAIAELQGIGLGVDQIRSRLLTHLERLGHTEHPPEGREHR